MFGQPVEPLDPFEGLLDPAEDVARLPEEVVRVRATVPRNCPEEALVLGQVLVGSADLLHDAPRLELVLLGFRDFQVPLLRPDLGGWRWVS